MADKLTRAGQTLATMNKRRRVRALIRQCNWTPVDIDTEGISYWEIRTWCAANIPAKMWEGSLRGTNGHSRFVFSREEYATLFRLKWL